jgi:hypothetical protein
MKNTNLFVLVTILSGCAAGYTQSRIPVATVVINRDAKSPLDVCGTSFDSTGTTGAYQSFSGYDPLGLAASQQASSGAKLTYAGADMLRACYEGNSNLILTMALAQGNASPQNSNPAWDLREKKAWADQYAADFLVNFEKVQRGGSAPAAAAPQASEVPSVAPSASSPVVAVSVRDAVAKAKNLGEIVAILTAEASKGGPQAAQYRDMAENVSTLPPTTTFSSEKEKILSHLP